MVCYLGMIKLTSFQSSWITVPSIPVSLLLIKMLESLLCNSMIVALQMGREGNVEACGTSYDIKLSLCSILGSYSLLSERGYFVSH